MGNVTQHLFQEMSGGFPNEVSDELQDKA